MNKNESVTMAAAIAVAAILTLAVAIPHHAFAGSNDDNNKKQVAIGGNGGSGGAGGAGGEGGQGGKNIVEQHSDPSCCRDNCNPCRDNCNPCNGSDPKIDQKANGGDSNGGHGGNANGGNAWA
jgi:hypothetical protein